MDHLHVWCIIFSPLKQKITLPCEVIKYRIFTVSDPARMDPMEYLADSAVIIPTESKENKEENEEEQDSTEEKKTEEKKPSTPGGEEKPKKDDRPLLAVVIRCVM